MKIKNYSLIVVILSFTFGCKSSKGVVSSGVINKDATAKYLIKENAKQESKFKTLNARVKIEYTQGEKTQNLTVSLRMEKEETIWLSAGVAGISLAKAMITPNRVQFYDKINNQFFDGDYTLISDLLGVDLDFKKVQNMLLGEAIFGLKEDKYVASIQENSYVLQPKQQKAVLELFYLLNSAHFKMDSQQLYQPLTRRILQIDYKSYQEVNKQILPEKMHIVAVEENEEVSINMEFKSVSLNEELRFPFKIPSGYKEIIIKNAE